MPAVEEDRIEKGPVRVSGLSRGSLRFDIADVADQRPKQSIRSFGTPRIPSSPPRLKLCIDRGNEKTGARSFKQKKISVARTQEAIFLDVYFLLRSRKGGGKSKKGNGDAKSRPGPTYSFGRTHSRFDRGRSGKLTASPWKKEGGAKRTWWGKAATAAAPTTGFIESLRQIT